MLVGILASLKLGAHYVPQHVGVATNEMLRRIALATGSHVVLTHPDLVDDLPAGLPAVLPISDAVGDTAIALQRSPMIWP